MRNGKGTKKKPRKEVEINHFRELREVDRGLHELAEHFRAIDKINLNLNKAISVLTANATAAAEPHVKQIEAIKLGIFVFATRNRKELTADGKKTISLPSGELGWRFNPPSVELRKIEAILEACKASEQLKGFIRTKEEVNKEEMLANEDLASTIQGVKIVKDVEVFFVKPAEVSAEIKALPVERTRKLLEV